MSDLKIHDKINYRFARLIFKQIVIFIYQALMGCSVLAIPKAVTGPSSFMRSSRQKLPLTA